ncbi:3-methyladenine DNA glycosylase [Gordonia aurantiaca]|uniref:3-methyladenine DNA glycosylase n=1 Tax=Gordonia sp. B21 TaxID=3151852 RepID=UPI0032661B94
MSAVTVRLESQTVLSGTEWRARRDAHRRRVDALIGPYLAARRRGLKHPVIDFLFTYYSSRPSHVLRWHPGFGITLADADEYLSLRGYERTDDAVSGVRVGEEYVRRRTDTLESTVALLRATASRPARLGCFGLHEWAMVYRADETRHDIPLRLGADGTDRVVESMPLRCTHFDAFRFFTEPARPRNENQLTRSTQIDHEQPGCLHATMDLYRYCFGLAPLLPAGLTVDCFEVALRARDLDMRASPYDLRHLGYDPVPVETPAGRAEYVREQSAIAEQGSRLRAEVLRRCEELLEIVSQR